MASPSTLADHMDNAPGRPQFDRPALDSVMAQVADVDGWMTPARHRRCTTALVAARTAVKSSRSARFRDARPSSWQWLLTRRCKVIAIDPHAGNDRGPQQIDGYADAADGDHAIFNKNLADAGVADRVRHLRMFSDDAHTEVAGEIGVLYVDGAHRYAPARADIVSWGARVEDGGTLLIHDSFSSIGVTFAILRELLLGSKFRYVGRSRSMTIYRADLASGPLDRVKNAAQQLAQLPWFVKNVALKVLLSAGLGKIMTKLGRTAPEWPY